MKSKLDLIIKNLIPTSVGDGGFDISAVSAILLACDLRVIAYEACEYGLKCKVLIFNEANGKRQEYAFSILNSNRAALELIADTIFDGGK